MSWTLKKLYEVVVVFVHTALPALESNNAVWFFKKKRTDIRLLITAFIYPAQRTTADHSPSLLKDFVHPPLKALQEFWDFAEENPFVQMKAHLNSY